MHLLAILTVFLPLARADFPTINGYRYLGCYEETTETLESGARTLNGGKFHFNTSFTSIGKCTQFCRADNYIYAGLEQSIECWCSNYLEDCSKRFEDEACDMACAGDPTQMCGGELKLSVYAQEDKHGIVFDDRTFRAD